MRSVLVVDDEIAVRNLTVRYVEAAGCRATACGSAHDALTAIRSDPPAVALCDVFLPGIDGLGLAKALRERVPEIAIIMITGCRDLDCAIGSLRLGAVDYLLKPYTAEQLAGALGRALERHRATVETHTAHRRLQLETAERQRQLEDAMAHLRVSSIATLEAMLMLLTLRDRALFDHSSRVARLAVRLGRTLHMTDDQIADLKQAALFHDVGKLAVPEAVLDKAGPLDDHERMLVRRHPEVGYEVMKAVPLLVGAAELVLASHEAYDGSGYPRGLRAEQIPLGSRILAIADSYDALTHARSYRKPATTAQALSELWRCRGTQFDPAVVEVLHEMARHPEGLADEHDASGPAMMFDVSSVATDVYERCRASLVH